MMYLPRAGDVLLFYTEGPLPWLIDTLAGPPAHAAIVAVDADGAAWSVGAEAQGVAKEPLDGVAARWGCRIQVRRRLAMLDDPPDWERELSEKALECVGVTEYDYQGLVSFLWLLVFPGLSWFDQPSVPRHVVCSELVSCLLRLYRGVDVVPKRRDAATSPHHLATSEWLATVCEDIREE